MIFVQKNAAFRSKRRILGDLCCVRNPSSKQKNTCLTLWTGKIFQIVQGVGSVWPFEPDNPTTSAAGHCNLTIGPHGITMVDAFTWNQKMGDHQHPIVMENEDFPHKKWRLCYSWYTPNTHYRHYQILKLRLGPRCLCHASRQCSNSSICGFCLAAHVAPQNLRDRAQSISDSLKLLRWPPGNLR